jgi:transposase
VAVETVGNWYWIADEIEAAKMVPQLVHAKRAKEMMGRINKTDKLDVRGLNCLQRTGTLPTVWIPPGEVRDTRELPRTRMVLVKQRTALKNRIHATLAKYGIVIGEVKDLFGVRGKVLLSQRLGELPANTRYVTEGLLEQVDCLSTRIDAIEERIEATLKWTEEVELVQTMPGVALVLGVVITNEVGDVNRFPSAGHLASYAGRVPRVHSSGGRTRHGRTRPDVNRYLKWAYTEAANAVVRHLRKYSQHHVGRLYMRVKHRRGHPTAIGAVGRHLAEATYWILRNREPYQDPGLRVMVVKRGIVSAKLRP